MALQKDAKTSLSTTELLNRQAELIKGEAAPSKINHGLPVYKSSKQIKQENYDLRHTKSFMRVLKMHSVMPGLLRKATEPPKVRVKDYAIDVDARVLQVVKDWKQKQREVKGSILTSESSGESDGTDMRDAQLVSSQKNDATAKNLKLLQARKKGFNWNKEKDDFKRRTRPKPFKYDPPPQGAQVVIDEEAGKQIEQIELGYNPKSNMREAFKQGILSKLDQTALSQLTGLRRRMSLLSTIGADAQIRMEISQQFRKAAEMQSLTHNMLNKRPHDKVHLLEKSESPHRGSKKSRKLSQGSDSQQPVAHAHYVKMSFEQLPLNLKEKLVYQNHDGRSQMLSNSKSNSIGYFTTTASQLSRPTSNSVLKNQTMASVTQNGKRKRPITSVKNKFDHLKSQVGLPAKSTNTTAQQASSDQSQMMPNLRGSPIRRDLQSRKKYPSQFSSSQQTLAAERVSQQSQAASRVIPQKRNQYAHHHRDNHHMSIHESTNMHRKNDSLFKFRDRQSNSSMVVNKKDSGAHGVSMGVHPYSQLGGSSTVNSSISGLPSRHRRKRDMNESVSNISQNQLDKLNLKHIMKRKLESGMEPMRRNISEDQLPIHVGEDQYLVRQEFLYDKPKKYRIEFARPAVYATGCLTCGNENANVEYYGERYCCQTCQKSLQTPTGEQVTLRASHDGRFIIAQAWKYSKPLNGIKIDIDDLRIRGGHKCHATFAGEKGDIIVLLDEVNEDFVYE